MKGYIKKYCRKLNREYKDKCNERNKIDEKNNDQVATTVTCDFFIIYNRMMLLTLLLMKMAR